MSKAKRALSVVFEEFLKYGMPEEHAAMLVNEYIAKGTIYFIFGDLAGSRGPMFAFGCSPKASVASVTRKVSLALGTEMCILKDSELPEKKPAKKKAA